MGFIADILGVFDAPSSILCSHIYTIIPNVSFLVRLGTRIPTRIVNRVLVSVESSEIARASLHTSIPWHWHLYGLPFLPLYPVLAYAYFIKYDTWLVSEEWTFLACVTLGAGHALSFLVTRWSTGARAWITTRKVTRISA